MLSLYRGRMHTSLPCGWVVLLEPGITNGKPATLGYISDITKTGPGRFR